MDNVIIIAWCEGVKRYLLDRQADINSVNIQESNLQSLATRLEAQGSALYATLTEIQLHVERAN